MFLLAQSSNYDGVLKRLRERSHFNLFANRLRSCFCMCVRESLSKFKFGFNILEQSLTLVF